MQETQQRRQPAVTIRNDHKKRRKRHRKGRRCRSSCHVCFVVGLFFRYCATSRSDRHNAQRSSRSLYTAEACTTRDSTPLDVASNLILHGSVDSPLVRFSETPHSFDFNNFCNKASPRKIDIGKL